MIVSSPLFRKNPPPAKKKPTDRNKSRFHLYIDWPEGLGPVMSWLCASPGVAAITWKKWATKNTTLHSHTDKFPVHTIYDDVWTWQQIWKTWLLLLTLFWRWLPLRITKHQLTSTTTILLMTAQIWTIYIYKHVTILPGLNHSLYYNQTIIY